MNFTLTKGESFEETFNFKNAQGKSIVLPNGDFKVILERGSFAREFTVKNGGLSRLRTGAVWRVLAEQSTHFEFTVMYYTLYLDDREITRGILRIQ